MDHLAIMKKSWKLIDKILSGRKTIESRWYMARYAPWNNIKSGDTVYFKDSGEPVTMKADVKDVLQFSNITFDKIKVILDKYGEDIGINKDEIFSEAKYLSNKKYCMLIFLRNPQKIQPFNINKQGFGNACAWLCVDDINKIRK